MQVTHLFLIDLKACRMPRNHIICWTMFLTGSVPWCWLSLCSFRRNNSTAWCFLCSNIGCFALKSTRFLPILPLARMSPSSSRKDANCRILPPFGFSFSAFRDFISSPNCSRCSNLKILAFAFSLSTMLATSVAGLCFFIAFCTYVTVFTFLLKLLNCSHWITAFFSSACIMKTDEVIFSSSEAKIRFTSSDHLLCGRFNQADPVSHWLLLSSSMLIARVPMSAGLLLLLTCFHCETSVVSSISATRLATNTCCLRFLFQLKMEMVLSKSDLSPGSTSFSQYCPFLVKMPFRSRLMWTLNGANYPIGSSTEDTSDRIVLWVIGSSISVSASAHL